MSKLDINREYYEASAQRFFDETANLDVSALYSPFIELIPEHASILDAGCGSGRDALAFSRLGYDVDAFDASPALANLAAQLLGKPVSVMRFQDLQENEKWDGIWASASLLHVPHEEMHEVFTRVWKALRPNGILYCSFKYGTGVSERNSRMFSDFTEDTFMHFLSDKPDWGLRSIWVSADSRPSRADEKWLNIIMSKGSKTSRT